MAQSRITRRLIHAARDFFLGKVFGGAVMGKIGGQSMVSGELRS